MTQDFFSVAGPVLVGTASVVNRLGLAAIAEGKTTFNLDGITEVDSAGVAVLLSWLREAKARNVALQFINVPTSLRNLAAVYDVDELIPG